MTDRTAPPGAGGLVRHIRACNNAILPGPRLRLRLGDHPIGWVMPRAADLLETLPDARRDATSLTLADLEAAAERLIAHRQSRRRRERFDVHDDDTGQVVAQIDRGALPVLGIRADGAHLNGLVRRPDGIHLWVGRRTQDRPLDPGKRDHLVAGGIPAGLTPLETLIKEAAEEAGLPSGLARHAQPVATISYAMDREEGLRRDRLHCFDLYLPETFAPYPADGEVAGFELWPIQRALEAVRTTDSFKFNVNLVLIDLFLRLDLVPQPEAEELRQALHP